MRAAVLLLPLLLSLALAGTLALRVEAPDFSLRGYVEERLLELPPVALVEGVWLGHPGGLRPYTAIEYTGENFRVQVQLYPLDQSVAFSLVVAW